jgi:hypothetical protein
LELRAFLLEAASLRQRKRDRADGQKQKQVKRASNKTRFNRGANVRFHFACAGGASPFTRTASMMSRLFARGAAHGDGKRFVVHADEKLTAFMELEAAIRLLGQALYEN